MNLFVTTLDLDKFNKAIFGVGSTHPFADIKTASLGTIISELLKYLFPFAGLLLFVFLLYGGFTYFTSGGEPKASEKARGLITNAIVGFLILFLAYWIVQIFEFMFGLNVFKLPI